MNYRKYGTEVYHRLLTIGAISLSITAVCSGTPTADQAAPAAPSLPEVLVFGTSPVPGMNIDIAKVPGNVESLFAKDLTDEGSASLIGALGSHLGSVNVNDTLADPFQPDILYRGFEASPVLGTPQGLAVYQNGVRINEAFGDTVNWDLFPDIAVSRLDIVSANPLYGLNALGGAMAVTMKNGFTFQGADGGLSGGSFNQRAGEAEYGLKHGYLGFYAAARLLSEDGWRLFSQDSVKQYYMDVSLHDGAAAIDLSYAHADTQLFGQGAAPVQSLAVDPTNVFTGPQDNINTLNFATLNGSYAVSQTLAVQVVVYSRNYRQSVANGDASKYTACSGASAGSLCQADGTTRLRNSAGTLIPDISNGGALNVGQNDFEGIHSRGHGASLQLTSTHRLFDHGNEFAVGATIDAAKTHFASGTEVGVLNSELTVLRSALFVSTPEGTGFSATPVSLDAGNKYYGFYAADTFDVSPLLSITASGRFNVAKIALSDQRGTDLDGNSRFSHLNPAVGATYKLASGVTSYAGYSTNTRAPTASEIECSDPLKPCLLPSTLAGDPPNLRQVIAHTVEVGLRGSSAASNTTHVSWNASVFRTISEDDIYGVSTSLSTGFFQNIGSTRRQGFETGIDRQAQQWSFYAQYSFIDATFRSPLTLNSPSNPFQDSLGNIRVIPGKHLPLIPVNRLKVGADFSLLPAWAVGFSFVLATGAFYKGDESNQNPQLPGYHVVGLRSSYRVGKRFEIFVNVKNVFDEHYATFGLFGDPTGIGAPGIPTDAGSNDPRVDNRFQSPAMPRAFFGGVRLSF